MIREIIKADCGIIFDKRKLRKLGIPDTEFGFRPNTNPDATRPQPPGGEVPQLPTISLGSEKVKQQGKEAREMDRAESTDDATLVENDAAAVPVPERVEPEPWWYRDSVVPLRDELMHQPGWWPLELLPFYVKHQMHDSSWKKKIR